ncbi:MAG: DoxX family protein [Gammaproteobacteria bacterium]|nr:DoxX family protein [Gammaproteobacteria bacterium]
MLDVLNDNKYLMATGRVLLVLIYFMGGIGVFTGSVPVEFAATKSIPSILVWLAFVLKLVGGLAIIVGFQTRIFALALAFFTVCTAFIFHYMDNVFWKEISMIGGLLLLAASGPGALSLDERSSSEEASSSTE